MNAGPFDVGNGVFNQVVAQYPKVKSSSTFGFSLACLGVLCISLILLHVHKK